MCFSSSASFGAGIVLTVIGVVSIKKTKHSSQATICKHPINFGGVANI